MQPPTFRRRPDIQTQNREERLVAEELCPNQQKDDCKCTYTSCSRRGRCCECLSYHLASKQLPGCCFPPEVEKTYDRSFAKFIETWG